ncbi:DUF2510 domain-containing protein [Ilumatobacter coccineus]|uniref:DUF2510 domain-containing protein n=1 Tax=Ilumatobacter coccineus (strain NBRC 103263 / KCTC 29153 / YM16-304) TaxID=1313172 RepID=A0A6C7E5P8_ILUCY|nr:DUF2510 domain-containing protein [Ilumatobacter coccineus]BAN00555.1 hypothetical protein YM304_02410 [Ilumatobacter coccineus YM16-304]
MRKADAPPAGWYPDPESRVRLRWWDGLDWTDIKRAPPSTAELDAAAQRRAFEQQHEYVASAQPVPQHASGLGRQDVQQIISEVRSVARSEIDRAAQEFSNRATDAVRGITPLITDYTSTALRWVKRAIIVAIVLLVAYFVFQVVVQASFFEWLGDRIDNLTDDSAPMPALGGIGRST